MRTQVKIMPFVNSSLYVFAILLPFASSSSFLGRSRVFVAGSGKMVTAPAPRLHLPFFSLRIDCDLLLNIRDAILTHNDISTLYYYSKRSQDLTIIGNTQRKASVGRAVK